MRRLRRTAARVVADIALELELERVITTDDEEQPEVTLLAVNELTQEERTTLTNLLNREVAFAAEQLEGDLAISKLTMRGFRRDELAAARLTVYVDEPGVADADIAKVVDGLFDHTRQQVTDTGTMFGDESLTMRIVRAEVVRRVNV